MWVELIAAALSIISKVMDTLPNYEQAKKQKFHKLKEEYYEEFQKPSGERDDNKLTDLYGQLVRFASDFAKEL